MGIHGESVAVGVLEAVGFREEFKVSVHSAPGSESEMGSVIVQGHAHHDKCGGENEKECVLGSRPA